MTHRYAPRYELTRVLASLWSVVPAGYGWIARCPLHPKGGHALSIHEGPGQGEAVVKCHFGCAPRLVLDHAFNLAALRRIHRRLQRKERATRRQA
jgi:hypothetical protein